MAPSLEETDHVGQKLAVQKHIGSLRIQGAKLGIVVMTDHVIDIGRHYVAKAVTPEARRDIPRLAKFVVVDVQDVAHIPSSRGSKAGIPSPSCDNRSILVSARVV